MYGKNNIKWKVLPGQKLLNLGEVQVPLVKWADQPEGKAPPLRFSHIRGLPETTSWDSLRGKWVYINFWAHWCGPCQRKMKDLVPWYHDNQHQRDHFEVIFVHASDARDFAIVDEKMPGLAARHWGIGKPFPFPMMLDADRDIASSYGVRLFPTEILVDPSGVVVTRPGGPGAFDDLKAKLGR
jgi:thiol-disulfide isomerase/thioredoxin